MPAYKLAWRAFRERSDENERTAEHLLSRAGWPRKPEKTLRIVDLGCGDGRMVEQLARLSGGCSILLVDPDREMLDESIERLNLSGLNISLSAQNERAETAARALMKDADVALAVHLLYLMDTEHSRELIDQLIPGVPCFFVLDDPGSIFTTLWERTAPKYHSRVRASHEMLSSLSADYDVTVSSFSSRLGDPFMLPADIATGVLSLLSYADYAHLPAEVRAWVDHLIRERTHDGFVSCACRCYEVVRRP